MIRVEVGEPDFNAGALLAELEALGGGGVASFTGVVRGGGALASLRLHQYPGMTQRMLIELAEAAQARWSLLGATIVHRVGDLMPGARIVFVGTASAPSCRGAGELRLPDRPAQDRSAILEARTLCRRAGALGRGTRRRQCGSRTLASLVDHLQQPPFERRQYAGELVTTLQRRAGLTDQRPHALTLAERRTLLDPHLGSLGGAPEGGEDRGIAAEIERIVAPLACRHHAAVEVEDAAEFGAIKRDLHRAAKRERRHHPHQARSRS